MIKKKKLHRPNQDVEHAVPPDFAHMRTLIKSENEFKAITWQPLWADDFTHTAQRRLQQDLPQTLSTVCSLWTNFTAYYSASTRLKQYNTKKVQSQEK